MTSSFITELETLSRPTRNYIKNVVEEYRELLLCSRYGDAYKYKPKRDIVDSSGDQTYSFQTSPNELLIEKQKPVSKTTAKQLMNRWLNWTKDDELFLEEYQVDKYHVIAAVCTALPGVHQTKDFNVILLELLEYTEMDEKFAIEILRSIRRNQYHAKCKPSDMLVFAAVLMAIHKNKFVQIGKWKKKKFHVRTEEALLEEMEVNSNIILTLKAKEREAGQIFKDIAGVLSFDEAKDFAALLSLREDSHLTEDQWKGRMEFVNSHKEKILNMTTLVTKQLAENELFAKRLQKEDKRLKDTVSYDEQINVVLEPIVEMNENLEFQQVPRIRIPKFDTIWSDLEKRLSKPVEEDSDDGSVDYNENASRTTVFPTSTVTCGSANLRSPSPAHSQPSDGDLSPQLSPSPPNSRESSVVPLLQRDHEDTERQDMQTNEITERMDLQQDDARLDENQPAPTEDMNNNADVDAEIDDFWNDDRQYLPLDEIRPETILRDIQIKIESGYEEFDIPQEHLDILIRNNIPIPNVVAAQTNSAPSLPTTSSPDAQLPEESKSEMNVEQQPVEMQEQQQPNEVEERLTNSALMNAKQEPVVVERQPIEVEEQRNGEQQAQRQPVEMEERPSNSTRVIVKQEPVEVERQPVEVEQQRHVEEQAQRQPVEMEERPSNLTLVSVKQELVEVEQQHVEEQAQPSTSTLVNIKQEPVEKEKKKKKKKKKRRVEEEEHLLNSTLTNIKYERYTHDPSSNGNESPPPKIPRSEF
ncbi:hypothetical protein M3Y94_01247700 [Aphelenchoides besseyi]|nr:hypothetical protein M3Y94_01247700 [Aphelenchoides besseyi]